MFSEFGSFAGEKKAERVAETDASSTLFSDSLMPDSILGRKPIQEAIPPAQSWQTDLLMPRFERRPSPWGKPSDVSSLPPAPNPIPAPERPAPRPVPPRPAPSVPRDSDWTTTPAPAPERPIPRPVPRPVPGPGTDTGGPWDKAPGAPWNKAPGGPWDTSGSGSDSGAGRPSNPRSAKQEEFARAFEQDKVSRTSYSFDNAVAKGAALGRENEVALELQMREWLGKQNSTNPITHMRGTAVLAASLGQFRLEEGSRIDLASHQNTKPRILKGYAYDFGGEANIWLRMAAGSLVSAQNYVLGHKDLVVEGQPMDDAYLRQLKSLQTKVEDQLEVIYGPHDIEAIYAEVRKQVRSNAGDWQQGLVRLKRQLDGTQSNDGRYVAKSARDVALGFLAEADYMSSRGNGEDAKIMYREANQYLAMSQRLDGAAPDNYALAKISGRLKPQIDKATDDQWRDPFNNPFEIPNPNSLIA